MNILKSKRSQNRVQEMIFMILAIAVFFLIVSLFYLSVTLTNLKKTGAEGARTSSILLVSALASSPEFNCPDYSGICVDADKVMALSNHPEYAKFWAVAGLRVEKVYPPSNSVVCTKGNYPFCSIIKVISANSTNVVGDASYVNLCRRAYVNSHAYVQCELAKIVIETERKI
jgi:hypothetical protein